MQNLSISAVNVLRYLLFFVVFFVFVSFLDLILIVSAFYIAHIGIISTVIILSIAGSLVALFGYILLFSAATFVYSLSRFKTATALTVKVVAVLNLIMLSWGAVKSAFINRDNPLFSVILLVIFLCLLTWFFFTTSTGWEKDHD